MEDQELVFDDTPLECSVEGCDFETNECSKFTEHIIEHLNDLLLKQG